MGRFTGHVGEDDSGGTDFADDSHSFTGDDGRRTEILCGDGLFVDTDRLEQLRRQRGLAAVPGVQERVGHGRVLRRFIEAAMDAAADR
ncbi:MAG TPA: hypothetical protein VFQ42_20375 [Mycobacterium sp.]|nr:hypothetical protein [Mycobacterium sp.]